jgi:hypothetical protein
LFRKTGQTAMCFSVSTRLGNVFFHSC